MGEIERYWGVDNRVEAVVQLLPRHCKDIFFRLGRSCAPASGDTQVNKYCRDQV